MKRRTFITLASLAAGLGLPLVGKAAQNRTPTESTVPIDDDLLLKMQGRRPVIKVIGVGGAGLNAVQHMIREGVKGVEFLCINTDTQRLNTDTQRLKNTDSNIPAFLRGLPGVDVSGEPQMGREWALSIRPRIAEMLKGARMVLITAGMGGGTATGAAPVVAEVARELGVRTVAVVTTPFAFEGKRVRRAREGLQELNGKVDSLYILSNETLMKELGEGVTLSEAFHLADSAIKDMIEDLVISSSINRAVNASRFSEAEFVPIHRWKKSVLSMIDLK